jgi:hypothetical protein
MRRNEVVDFFSARLLYIILVNDGRSRKRNHYDEVVIVFRARNFDSAFNRALEIGHANETEYLNQRKQTVRWALIKIINLDWVGKRIDGKEVASFLHHKTGEVAIAPTTQFQPEKTPPNNSF